MKTLLFIIVAIFLSACSTKSSYLLPTSNVLHIKTVKTQIGVKEVEVPDYLDGDKILVKDGAKIEEIGSNFAAPPSKLLTQNVIKILKKSLNNPYVFLYPWDVKNKKGLIVDIKLDNFLYDSRYCIVEGTYYIKNANGTIKFAKNFKYQELADKNPNNIIMTLSALFDKVALEIAQKIAKW